MGLNFAQVFFTHLKEKIIRFLYANLTSYSHFAMLAFKLRKFQTLVLLLLFDFEALRKLYNYYFFPRKFPEANTQSEKLLQGKELIFCWCTWHPLPRNWNSLPIGATSAHSAICCLFLPLPFLHNGNVLFHSRNFYLQDAVVTYAAGLFPFRLPAQYIC